MTHDDRYLNRNAKLVLAVLALATVGVLIAWILPEILRNQLFLEQRCERIDEGTPFGVRGDSFRGSDYPLYYLVTTDGGTSWQEIKRIEGDARPIPPECQSLIVVDADTFAVWHSGLMLEITHDGGDTWLTFDPQCSVEHVTFQGDRQAWMVVLCPVDNVRRAYQTSDGGENWFLLDE